MVENPQPPDQKPAYAILSEGIIDGAVSTFIRNQQEEKNIIGEQIHIQDLPPFYRNQLENINDHYAADMAAIQERIGQKQQNLSEFKAILDDPSEDSRVKMIAQRAIQDLEQDLASLNKSIEKNRRDQAETTHAMITSSELSYQDRETKWFTRQAIVDDLSRELTLHLLGRPSKYNLNEIAFTIVDYMLFSRGNTILGSIGFDNRIKQMASGLIYAARQLSTDPLNDLYPMNDSSAGEEYFPPGSELFNMLQELIQLKVTQFDGRYNSGGGDETINVIKAPPEFHAKALALYKAIANATTLDPDPKKSIVTNVEDYANKQLSDTDLIQRSQDVTEYTFLPKHLKIEPADAITFAKDFELINCDQTEIAQLNMFAEMLHGFLKSTHQEYDFKNGELVEKRNLVLGYEMNDPRLLVRCDFAMSFSEGSEMHTLQDALKIFTLGIDSSNRQLYGRDNQPLGFLNPGNPPTINEEKIDEYREKLVAKALKKLPVPEDRLNPKKVKQAISEVFAEDVCDQTLTGLLNDVNSRGKQEKKMRVLCEALFLNGESSLSHKQAILQAAAASKRLAADLKPANKIITLRTLLDHYTSIFNDLSQCDDLVKEEFIQFKTKWEDYLRSQQETDGENPYRNATPIDPQRFS